MDMKFGLYSDAGAKTCEGRPGGLGYEVVDARKYAEWKYRNNL
jgi:alpha-galactosidase